MADEKKTIDHHEVKNFAEKWNMTPAAVQSDVVDGGQKMIRLMPSKSKHGQNDNLNEISWDEWFDVFEKDKLALVYDAEGDFIKLVNR